MKKENTKKVLIVVDVQHDFVSPAGSLYVNGSEDIAERIVSIMDGFDAVVFTMDSHPWNHKSFKDEGGEWPRHCVMNTSGGSIPDILMKSVCGKPIAFLRKGENVNEEEYGAFDNDFNKCDFGNALVHFFPNATDKVDVYVCGVAGDYCVANTVKGLKYGIDHEWFAQYDCMNCSIHKINDVYIIKDLCPCIDPNYDIDGFADETGVIATDSDKLARDEKNV